MTSVLVLSLRRSTYNHLSSWLTDARNLTNPNTVSVAFILDSSPFSVNLCITPFNFYTKPLSAFLVFTLDTRTFEFLLLQTRLLNPRLKNPAVAKGHFHQASLAVDPLTN